MQIHMLEKILSHREALIDQMELGLIDKRGFLTITHEFFEKLNYRPQRGVVKSLDQGLADYQYYNAYAKYHMMLKEELEFKNSRASMQHFNKAMDFYTMKDKVTMNLVILQNYANMEAYYLEMHSKALEGSLIEIVFTDEHRVIFHSKDKRLLYRLEQNGVFKGETRPSIISDYVNTRY